MSRKAPRHPSAGKETDTRVTYLLDCSPQSQSRQFSSKPVKPPMQTSYFLLEEAKSTASDRQSAPGPGKHWTPLGEVLVSVPLQTCSSFGPYLGSEHKHEEHCSVQHKKPRKAVGTIPPECTARKSSRNKKELKLKFTLLRVIQILGQKVSGD